jgi:hypothetical protein
MQLHYLWFLYVLLKKESEMGETNIKEEFRELNGFDRIAKMSENPNLEIREAAEDFLFEFADVDDANMDFIQ